MTRPRSKSPITRRLGVYFLGVAIGLVLVGFLVNARRAMVRSGGEAAPAQQP